MEILRVEHLTKVYGEKENRVVALKYSFLLKTKLKEYNIMPGTYILNTSMDYNDILEIITNASNSIAQEESVEGGSAGGGGAGQGAAGAEGSGAGQGTAGAEGSGADKGATGSGGGAQ